MGKLSLRTHVLGIEIVCVRPSKGLNPICHIKTLNDVRKKEKQAHSREMESHCKVVEVYSVKKSYLNTPGISQTV